MESIWWVFKQLFQKGLVYRGFKVMPFSTACSTPLSNFESGQNYKEVVDPAGNNFETSSLSKPDKYLFFHVVIVSFPLDEDPSVSLLAWTTTPWTLPSNLALCVNAALDYVKVKGMCVINDNYPFAESNIFLLKIRQGHREGIHHDGSPSQCIV